MKFDLFTWAGLVGLVFLAMAGLSYGVRGAFDWPIWVLLGLAVAGLAAYLSKHAEQVKEGIFSRRARYGANALVLTLAVLAALAFVQAILTNHNVSWDLSKGQINSLADETVKVVKNLDQKITLLCFFNEQDRAGFEPTLKKIRDINPAKISFEFVNPNKSPLLAQQYSVKSFGSTVIKGALKHELITSNKEEDLVNGMIKVSGSGSKLVCFLQGHQELSTGPNKPSASEFKRALENTNYTVRDLNLVQEQGVPAGTVALIIAGPQTDLVPAEVEVLKAYLARGGSMMVALDARTARPLPNLSGMLKMAGVVVGGNLVVDPILRLFGGDPVVPVVQEFDRGHAILNNLSLQVVMPICRTIDLPAPVAGAEGNWLMRANATAWAYTGSDNKIPSKPGPKDVKGTLNLAVAFTAEPKVWGMADATSATAKAKVAVYGSAQAFSNEAVAVYNNQDLALNTIRWMASDEKHVSIKAREAESTPLVVSAQRMSLIWILGLLVLPGLIAIVGIAVAVRRSRSAE
jgi:ABC-type uncharacterized transport system involved in gliding motility auxiliary subunit